MCCSESPQKAVRAWFCRGIVSNGILLHNKEPSCACWTGCVRVTPSSSSKPANLVGEQSNTNSLSVSPLIYMSGQCDLQLP